jgi:CubicO group peptidase (beta-lactamase class C family)
MDVVKIGILVMNNGKWKNQQLISEDWIRKATSSYLSTSFDSSTYGYFWWIRDIPISGNRTTRVVSAEGYGGQKLFILPEYRMVVSITERNYNTPRIGEMFFNESVLPALQ